MIQFKNTENGLEYKSDKVKFIVPYCSNILYINDEIHYMKEIIWDKPTEKLIELVKEKIK